MEHKSGDSIIGQAFGNFVLRLPLMTLGTCCGRPLIRSEAHKRQVLGTRLIVPQMQLSLSSCLSNGLYYVIFVFVKGIPLVTLIS